MALDLYMLGLIVQDMPTALAFYRRLGLAIPEGSDNNSHVEVKMGSGLTFFLDSRPARWDPAFAIQGGAERPEVTDGYTAILEFYLHTQAAVDALYADLTSHGYRGYRAPYATTFGMYFAMIKDPDGHTILLSGDLASVGAP